MSMEPLTDDDPKQVAGYQVRARLGAGGMGRVYLALTAGGRPVALKVIRPELGGEPDFRTRFRQEVEAARRVSGLYTAQVLDANPDASPPWLVTAYVPGPSLQQAVSEHGPLPLDAAFLLAAGVAEALEAIHAAGLVHRDLKPSNVLLAPDGPRVIDFGIARAAEATTVTRTGLRVGSPPYMAPEQVQGLPVTPATDVFALGSVVAYAATGRIPFGTGNEQAILYRVLHQEPDLDGCPEALRALIGRCLAKVPPLRPSPGEIIGECRAHTAGQTLTLAQPWVPAAVSAGLAPHVSPVQPTVTAALAESGPDAAAQPAPPRRNGRKPLVALLAAAAVVAGAGTALAVSLNSGSTSSHSGNTTAAQQQSTVSASPPPDSAACATGSWRAVSEQNTSTIDGQPTLFAGSGAMVTARPDGTFTTTYDKVVLSATVDGAGWTETFQGQTSGRWAVGGGDLRFSSVSSSGTVLTEKNGAYDNSGPLKGPPSAVPFQCSGNTLHFNLPNGQWVLTRVAH